MKMFKKKDDGDKKPKVAAKPAAKLKMIPSSKGMKMALGVDSVQAGKKYAFTKESIARRDSVKAAPKSVKTVPAPKMKAASPGLKKALGVDSLQSGKFYPYTKESLAMRKKSTK